MAARARIFVPRLPDHSAGRAAPAAERPRRARHAALVLLLTVAAVAGCRDGAAERRHALAEGARRFADVTARPADGSAAPAAPPAEAVVPPPWRYLRVEIVSGAGIVESDPAGGDADPFVVVEYGGERRRTAAVSDARDCTWGDSFVFAYEAGAPLGLSLFDADAASDDLLGTVSVFPFEGAAAAAEQELKIPFKNGENGVVTIRLRRTP